MTDLGSGSSGVVLMYYVGSSRRALGLERVERVCGRAGNWGLGLGEQMTAHQEKYVAWVFKAWLGFKIGGHSGNLVGNYVVGSTVRNRIQVWWVTVIVDFLGVWWPSKMCSATLFQQ